MVTNSIQRYFTLLAGILVDGYARCLGCVYQNDLIVALLLGVVFQFTGILLTALLPP